MSRFPVILTFDVEDPITPESDDATLAMAEILSARRVVGAFYVVGDKALALRSRRRADVVAALRKHAVGFHTSRHSVHPTLAEYVQHLDWSGGIDAIVDHERPGVEAVAEIFDTHPVGFATAGTSWAPQVAAASERLGLGYHVHSFSRENSGRNLHWFGGTPCLSRTRAVGPFDSALLDESSFKESVDGLANRLVQERDGGAVLGHVFVGHPTCLVTTEFWDKLNYDQKNPDDPTRLRVPGRRPVTQTRAALRRFEALVDLIADDSRFQIVDPADVVAEETGRPRPCSPAAIAEALNDVERAGTPFGATALASAAELAYVLACDFLGTPIRHVPFVGAPDEPPLDYPGGEVAADELVGAATELRAVVERTGRLPVDVSAGGSPMPVGAVLAALLFAPRAGLRADNATGADLLRVPAVRGTSGLGDEMARHLAVRLRRWLHRPDLDVTRLVLLTALQAWTVRPAHPGSPVQKEAVVRCSEGMAGEAAIGGGRRGHE